MKSKLISIPYTVGIIKPHIALQEDKVDEIYRILDQQNFEVFTQKRKILTNEEILNLFAPYQNKGFFNDIHEHMQTAESIVLLLINKVEQAWDEERGEEVKLESPIVRWKQLIGDKDPEVAKGQDGLPQPKVKNPETDTMEDAPPLAKLRATHGKDIIRNAVWGSDDAKAANKERDIFLLPIPERPPEFSYIRTKVTVENILKFMFPPNLEHSNSTGRLDLFSLYGPTVNYHSVDSFCPKCIKIAKNQLKVAILRKQDEDRRKAGLGDTIAKDKPVSMRTGNKMITQTRKLMEAPQRLLQEDDINEIMPMLCNKCQERVEGFVNLTCGRGGQHVNTDIEIDEMIREINKRDILNLLIVEKGSSAKMMIQILDLSEPSEIMYTPEHMHELIKDLETDYYGRYEFDDLQKMILEDRRLRINYMVSKIIHKPIEKFKNPNLLNQNEKVNRKDIKNPYFSLSRILPISLHMQRTNKEVGDSSYDVLHFDYKTRYIQAEHDLVCEKTISKEYHRVTDITQPKDNSVGVNSLILRNYNDGRNGGWNNYCCYDKKGKGDFVKKHGKDDQKASQFKRSLTLLEAGSKSVLQTGIKGMMEEAKVNH